MVNFGVQLEEGLFPPWKEYYIQYNRLKRLIVKRKFVLDKIAKESEVPVPDRSVSFMSLTKMVSNSSDSNPPVSMVMLNEMTPLSPGFRTYSSSDNAKKGKGKEKGNGKGKGKGKEDREDEDMEDGDIALEMTSLDIQAKTAKVMRGGNMYVGVSRISSSRSASPTELNEHSLHEDTIDFFSVIKENVESINRFFLDKLKELREAIDDIANKRRNAYRTHHSGANQIDLTKLRDVYVQLAALSTYSDLNYTGFYKIIKKYDKTMKEQTLETWMSVIGRQPFATTNEPKQLIEVLGGLVSRDKLLEWDRFATDLQDSARDEIFPAIRIYGLLISVALFVLSLAVPLMVIENNPAATRCVSLLIFTVCLWVTEAMPYYATALLSMVMVVFMGVLKESESSKVILPVDQAAQFVANHIFNHTTILLLGGYTISSAISRCKLELRIAAYLQEAFGSYPHLFILAIMFVGLFLSMWINNHTAPILCATIILPIVKDLPSTARFSKALLIGLAFACNFGGMMTPISSLQNVLAVSSLETSGIRISFGHWLGIAVPFCIMGVLVTWVLLLIVIKPNDIASIPIIVYEPEKRIPRKNLTIMFLTFTTIVMFAMSSVLNQYFGDICTISLLFCGVMYGSGLLTEVDFNSLSWHTLFLVGGGNVLGKAIETSGLLSYIVSGIISLLPLSHPWISLLCILTFTGTVATFVSHTVAAIILTPVIAHIGVVLGIPEVTVIGSAFAISGAMTLPFSSFPNVNSLLLLDDFQKPYLSVMAFVKTGLPMSIITILLIASFGWWLIVIQLH